MHWFFKCVLLIHSRRLGNFTLISYTSNLPASLLIAFVDLSPLVGKILAFSPVNIWDLFHQARGHLGYFCLLSFAKDVVPSAFYDAKAFSGG